MIVDSFTLISGASIKYKTLKFKQPKLIEIGEIGEQYFYDCLSYFLIKKEKILQSKTPEDQQKIKNITQVQFIMLWILENPKILLQMNQIFNLILDSNLIISQDATLQLVNAQNELFNIENQDWDEISSVIKQIFCIKVEASYNTKKSIHATRIAEKMKAAKEKINKDNNKNFSPILGPYCSIVAVGNNILISEIVSNYTLYQLMNHMKRFNKYEEYNIKINSAMHGAKIDNLKSWCENIDDDITSKNTSESNIKEIPGTKINEKGKN